MRARYNYSYKKEKKTVTYNQESNALKRGKRRITEHKRREEDVHKQKGGCAQDGKRMRTGRKENMHVLQSKEKDGQKN